ncbi:hypothetical protein H1W00_04555 [Aeromicrobium sp. Marseille-Q0843]|uniref:Abi-like protein n=1 Tax=Aeromicrobium phoceense TaxID=2754045 RepID=A0A838XFP1_9ACTN|nr:hypothetical protein [Aeromicrobium phoceense]MBA4607741.1 hypothetical protein [Aeromicrobium phoceense]
MSIDADEAWNDVRIAGLLTHERLSSYLAVTPDLGEAIRLYEWNVEASASLMATTGMVEVIVRNALDERLAEWAAARGKGPWFDLAPLDQRGRRDIVKARERASKRGREPVVHGKVVAELSFGFWRYLVARRYHASLWVPALHRAFPQGHADLRERRRQVEDRLTSLTIVRNRAAHHEPIHRRNLLSDLRAAKELASWGDVEAGAWVGAKSSVEWLVDRRGL